MVVYIVPVIETLPTQVRNGMGKKIQDQVRFRIPEENRVQFGYGMY